MISSQIISEIVSINSYDKTNSITNVNHITIGTDCCYNEFRGLVKFDLTSLPQCVKITRAYLGISVATCSEFKLYGFEVTTPWDINKVNWMNQPKINYSNTIINKPLLNQGRYEIDITDQVIKWSELVENNYGMVLMGTRAPNCKTIQVCTNKSSKDNITLTVEYMVLEEIHNVPTFCEYLEYIHVNGGGEFFTSGINVSLMTTVSFFVNNTNTSIITINAENSPDNLHFAKEIQRIYILPGQSSLLVPINFSKYVRLSIMVPSGGSASVIPVWFNVQQ